MNRPVAFPKLARYSLALVCLLSVCAISKSQDNSAIEATHTWRASWITSTDAPRKDECVLRFRKQLTLQSIPQHYLVYVSADNQFLLVVNGTVVGVGPSHSDLQHWKYETYDIGPILRPGVNLIAATVWNLGNSAPVRQITDRIGFLIDTDSPDQNAIRSDDTWEVAVDKGISTLPIPAALQRGPYFASPGELIDGGSLLWDWSNQQIANQQPGVWKKASIIGRAFARGAPFLRTKWQLVPDTLPNMERAEQNTGRVVRLAGLPAAEKFPNGRLEIPAHRKVSLLIDAGRMTTAYPELTLSKGEHSRVILTYAEALYDAKNKKGNRNEIAGKHILGIYDEIHPSGGLLQVYTPLDWRAWRYLQIDIKTEEQPLELSGLRAWFTAYPFQQVGSFTSDDASLKPIWDIGWLTARLNAHDTYMDPYWEQLQYTGDTRIQALISYAVGGDDRLARQAIEAFRYSTTSDGITLDRYPSSIFQIIPGYSLCWVGMVHDFWMYRNDPEFVRAQLPVVRSTLDWFRSKENKNHLLGKLPWWPFVDWADGFETGAPPETLAGDSAIHSLQLLETLRYAAEMESSLGDKALAIEDADEASHIASSVYKLCWDPEWGLIADTPERTHFSQHANALAVWLDVIPAADQQNVIRRILSASDPLFDARSVPAGLSLASPYYRFYIARALVHAGLGDRYLETLGPWKAMVSNGLTTWEETPEPSRSDSCAWSAHPNYDLLTIVAGISPATPNFASVKIEPHPGGLHHVDATLPSPSGEIRAVLDARDSELIAKIALPAGMTGTIVWKGVNHNLAAGSQELRLGSTEK